MSLSSNPYLEGNYAPVSKECTTGEPPVSGALPDALCGRYLRNGPNPVTPPDPSTYHWFSGTGMVHGPAPRTAKPSGIATGSFAPPTWPPPSASRPGRGRSSPTLDRT